MVHADDYIMNTGRVNATRLGPVSSAVTAGPAQCGGDTWTDTWPIILSLTSLQAPQGACLTRVARDTLGTGFCFLSFLPSVRFFFSFCFQSNMCSVFYFGQDFTIGKTR